MPKKIKAGLFAYMLFPMAVFGQKAAEGLGKSPVARHDKSTHKAHHKTAALKVQYGVASYYANKFEGRKTYTDEIFSQEKLTAASNTLPMHTWVRVTNLRNNRSVVLRINDKMHPKNKRLIDLSQAAAARLGYKGRGLTHVRVDVFGKKKPPEAESEAVTKDGK